MKNKLNYLSLAFLSFVSVLIGNTSFALAQAEGTAPVVAAIEKMASAEQIVFSGSAETPEVGGGMAGMQMMIVGGGQTQSIFEDSFEVVVTPGDQEALICSKGPFPGIAIYQLGGDVITSTTFGEEKFDTENLTNDLTQILDLDNLKKFVGKVDDCKVTTHEGSTTYSCSLSKRFIRSLNATGPQAMLAAAVLDIKAMFKLNEAGELVDINVEVVREDPVGKLMKMGNARMGGADGELDPAVKEQIKKQFAEKKLSTIYQLQFEATASERSTETLKQMRSLIDEY